MTHKGAAADSGHYIGFVKKSVFYAAKAKANAFDVEFERRLNQIEELVNTPLPEIGTYRSNPMFASVANSLINGTDPAEAQRLLVNAINTNDDPTDSNSAPVAGPSALSTVAYDSEEDEDWFKFDDEKVTDFPKEKLPSLEGGGEDSSAYVLVYRSKVL